MTWEGREPDAPRVFAAVQPPGCSCAWDAAAGDPDLRLVVRDLACPLHGPGCPFDYWGTDG